MIQRHILNGVEINEPNNYEQLSIELNYEKNNLSQVVTVNNWEVGTGDNRQGKDGLTILKTYLEKGLSGGPGVTEGIPFVIKLDDEQGEVFTLFDGYLDLWSAKIEPDRIKAPATEQGKLDWLNQVADSVTFEYLYRRGLIQDHHFVRIPYVINRKANGVEVIAAVVSLYVVLSQIVSVIKEIIALVNDYDIVYISMIIRVIALLVYFAALLLTAIQLITDLYNQIIQPIKYHYAMKVQDAMRISLEYFGLTLSSSILQTGDYSQLVWLPEKYNLKEDNTGVFDGVIGLLDGAAIDRKGFPRGTPGQFIRMWENHFNAKILIEGNIFYFEDQDFNIPKANYVMPKVELQGYTFNKDEFFSNIEISYATDLNDRNTIQEYLGTSVQIIQQPKTIQNKKMVLTRQLQQNNFPFALGKRKVNLTFGERRIAQFQKDWNTQSTRLLKILSPVLRAYESVLKVSKKFAKALKAVGINPPFNLNNATPLAGSIVSQKINEYTYKLLKAVEGGLINVGAQGLVSRKGMLMMENDFVMVPKALILSIDPNYKQTKISDLNATRLNARYVWERFHKYKSFVPDANGKHNQYLKYDTPEYDFTFEDFKKVRLSNRIFDSDMNQGKLLSLKFFPTKGVATASFQINSKYTDNLTLEIIEPDGK